MINQPNGNIQQTSSLGSVARLGKRFIIWLSVCGDFSVNNRTVHFMHLNHSLKLRAKLTEPKVKVTKLIWLHGWGAGRFRRGRSTTFHFPTKGLRGESNDHVCSGERGKGEEGIKISRLLERQKGAARGQLREKQSRRQHLEQSVSLDITYRSVTAPHQHFLLPGRSDNKTELKARRMHRLDQYLPSLLLK